MILGIVLEMDKRRTSTNETEEKKANDDVLFLTSEGWPRVYVSRKERIRGLGCIEDNSKTS